MLSVYRDQNVLERSLMRNMIEARNAIAVSHPEVVAMTVFLFEDELQNLREEVQDTNILVIYGLGPSNPFESNPKKVRRIIKFRVEYKNLRNREHIHVINGLRETFKPGLSYKQWNPNGSNDFVDYTELAPMWIQDLKDENGYNGNDGRYVLPFALDVKFPQVIN